MCNIICVTNRKECEEQFFVRLAKVTEAGVLAVILREKDLPPEEYRAYAIQAKNICEYYGVPCILHTFAEIADEESSDCIHLSMSGIRELDVNIRKNFKVIGVSVHSAEEAEEAEKLGATYLTAGHIFMTDCKKDIPPKGLEYLKEICSRVSIPVYAIGGVCGSNYKSVENAGAAGACIMGALMRCKDPAEYIRKLREELGE